MDPAEPRLICGKSLIAFCIGCGVGVPGPYYPMIIPTTKASIIISTLGARRVFGNESILSWSAKYARKLNARNGLRHLRLIHSRLRRPHGRPRQIGGEERGYDAGKCVKGRKRFILVDTMGLLLAVKVVAASVSEKAGAKLLLEKIWSQSLLKELCGRLELVWVDSGYGGDDLYDWVGRRCGGESDGLDLAGGQAE